MPSMPLDSIHSRTLSCVACHNIPWTSLIVERLWAWNVTISLGQFTQSIDLKSGMPSSPFDCTHRQTMLDVACLHRICKAHTVERHRGWHTIMALRHHAQSDNVGCGMPLLPLYFTHGRETWNVACLSRPCTAHTVERRRAWHVIIALDNTQG